jgi:dihydrofolate reductase
VVPLHLIVARARNGVIGDRGALPWRLPEDLAFFKRTTMGHAIIMGRKTWDSIGRPLPGRLNIVVTREPCWAAAGALSAASLTAARQLAGAHYRSLAKAGQAAPCKAFVIGGAQLYALALAGDVEAIHLTQIDADFAGDAHFALPDPARWRESSREHFGPQADRPFGFDFIRYDAIDAPPPRGAERA